MLAAKAGKSARDLANWFIEAFWVPPYLACCGIEDRRNGAKQSSVLRTPQIDGKRSLIATEKQG
jgi:hypothetical protein